MKNIFTSILILAVIFPSYSQEKRLARKAANAIDQSDYTLALSYYDQILAKDSNSFRGNAGKGIVLSEFMGRYDKAIPYLEKAIKKSPEEVSPKINGDLGKSYHQIGNYPRALYFYGKTTSVNDEDSPYYDPMLVKRIADCKYALEHPEIAPPEEQFVKNIGPAINTDLPEYGPVYANGNMIFTSKRKDTQKEKKNGIDGRYFESMYLAKAENGGFSTPRRYTIPDLGENSVYHRSNESAVSVSGDKLYFFKGGDLYVGDLYNTTKAPDKLPHKINAGDFQTFASTSPDGNIMYFVSESLSRGGGTDIYQAYKNADGSWSNPQLLPFSINTEYYEDAPFVSEDGTLYFASNGLPGYGGFDIYKTHKVDGQWTTPENLGQPINTPGDELYFALGPNSPNGYYASSRQGGMGDMDIYRVHYVPKDIPECNTMDPEFAINTQSIGDMSYAMSALIPEKYKGHVKSISWKVNGLLIAGTSEKIEYTFASPGTYKVSAKAVVFCDDCPSLVAVCTEKEVNIGQLVNIIVPEVITTQPVNVPVNQIGNLQPVYFDYDEYALRDDAKSSLDKDVKMLKDNKGLSITISGYADARGTNEYNRQLSAKRINSVKTYLLQSGVSRYKIGGTFAYGESMIENGCVDYVECTEEKHQENRKVEIKINNAQLQYTRASID